MRPDELVEYVLSKRGEASRVAVHKIIYLADSDFVRRRMIARMMLLKGRMDLRVRNESGIKYYYAKLGPFSPSIQNAIKRLLKAGKLDEEFKDGRFVYVPKKELRPKVKEYFAKVIDGYVQMPEDRLVEEALRRAKFDPTVERTTSF